MNIILYAGPVFLILIVGEYVYGRWRGNDTYRLSDTLNSIGLGAISRVLGLFLGLGAYAWALQHWALFQLPADSAWTWISALVFYDFTYYWSHRFGHTMNLFWAHHVVHHQSERYNLSTALRQGSFGFFGFIFGLPLAICGYPVEVVALVGVIDLYYQYWIHTEHIGKLGWFDRVFASPSNHRVHHAINDAYLDKNYGGIFIIWDRLFGSFAEEDASNPPVYGTRAPLRSWNPLWALSEVYWSLATDAWHARRWRDKLSIWFAPPGWRPADVATRFPRAPFDLGREEFNPPVQRRLGLYCGVQFAFLILASLYFIAIAKGLPPVARYGALGYLLLGYVLVGWLLEGRRIAVRIEWLRWALTASLPWWLARLTGIEVQSPVAAIVLPSVCAVSALWLWWAASLDVGPEPAATSGSAMTVYE